MRFLEIDSGNFVLIFFNDENIHFRVHAAERSRYRVFRRPGNF